MRFRRGATLVTPSLGSTGRHRAPSRHRLTPFRITLILLVLAAQVGYLATVSLADGGDFTLDYLAAAPGTYDTTTGTGGEYNDRIIGTNVVESLEGGDFACGDIVEFFTAVTTDAGATGTQTIEINYSFSAVTTSNDPVGFGDIIYAQVNPGDSGNLNLEGDETATLIAENDGETETTGTVEVTGLDAGDQVIVALGVELVCEVSPENVTGNILTAITSAETSEGDPIPLGEQTVPLKSAGEIAAPGITISKTCTPEAQTGEDITYDITITNTGNEVLDIDSVVDTVLGDITSSFPATLDPGASDTETFTHTVTPDDPNPLVNSVTVEATGQVSGVTATADAQCSTVITQTVPAIDVTKTCTPEVEVGGTVTYTITVTNTGTEAIENITVNDTLLGDLSDSFVDTLDPGESDEQTFTRAQQPGDPDPILNEVTASANGVFHTETVTDTADCSTDVVHVPAIDVEKSCPEKVLVGDVIDYEITVTNTGNEPLENVTVVDSVLGDLSDQFSDTFEVGQSETVTIEHQATKNEVGDLENTVAASGTGADSAVTATDSATCVTKVRAPVIAVTGANADRGLGMLLVLLLGGATFLFLGRRPQLAVVGSPGAARRGTHAAGMAPWTVVMPYRGSHRRRSRGAGLWSAHGT